MGTIYIYIYIYIYIIICVCVPGDIYDGCMHNVCMIIFLVLLGPMHTAVNHKHVAAITVCIHRECGVVCGSDH